MSAEIYSLSHHRQARLDGASAHEPVSRFASFEEVCGFAPADPVWVSEDLRECCYAQDDAARLAAFFAWFGVTVDLTLAPQEHGDGWEYLVGEFSPAAAWKRSHPTVFKAICGDWDKDRQDYLTALMVGDSAATRRLLTPAGVARELQQKMRTSFRKSALK